MRRRQSPVSARSSPTTWESTQGVVAARVDSTTGSWTYNLKVVTGAKTNTLFGTISSVTCVTNLPSGKELYVTPGDYAFADGVSATNGTANAVIFTER